MIKYVYRISTALRTLPNRDSENPNVLVLRNEHHRHGCSLFSIDSRFPKLDVAQPGPTEPVSSKALQERLGCESCHDSEHNQC